MPKIVNPRDKKVMIGFSATAIDKENFIAMVKYEGVDLSTYINALLKREYRKHEEYKAKRAVELARHQLQLEAIQDQMKIARNVK